jgi:hypothetical protein
VINVKEWNANDACNKKERHHSLDNEFTKGSSQLISKKRRRDNEGLSQDNIKNKEEAGLEILQEEPILSKAIEDNIQQIRQRVGCFACEIHLNLLSRKYDPRIVHNFST